MDIQHTFGYTAVFEDGTMIEHDCKDPNSEKSLTKENGTKFSDILAKEEESKLISFVVHNDTYSFGVDLTDGHFEVNGIPFFQHRPDLTPYEDFRVIYYRTVRRELNQVTGECVDAQLVSYTVGWQTTFKGENVQRTITI